MIDLLKDLIKIESDTKEGANEALLFCSEWLKERGEEVELHDNDGYLMLTAAKGKAPKRSSGTAMSTSYQVIKSNFPLSKKATNYMDAGLRT